MEKLLELEETRPTLGPAAVASPFSAPPPFPLTLAPEHRALVTCERRVWSQSLEDAWSPCTPSARQKPPHQPENQTPETPPTARCGGGETPGPTFPCSQTVTASQAQAARQAAGRCAAPAWVRGCRSAELCLGEQSVLMGHVATSQSRPGAQGGQQGAGLGLPWHWVQPASGAQDSRQSWEEAGCSGRPGPGKLCHTGSREALVTPAPCPAWTCCCTQGEA